MAEKYRVPDRPGDLPPPYSAVDPSNLNPIRPTLVVDANSNVFHKGARFNEFAKPIIPPPPPGCPPNHFQQMQMEKGQFNVVLSDGGTPPVQNKYGTF
ncbi:DAZ-associated protein 2-like [Mercenaria mercenaria]|uniref:DAZ-associated protein 2-like n=1 Tax=Mercenaria mercenaria TaxID=6596 RepID=UPI00234E7CDB|nr:DAZ-associated protein 2-like [Mercenaria mercenaria]